ncbi:hypothetical protein Btru_041833 [Bulinus truncatus]|nr:hypothetical protein Btru_041833 [Bulinus truncatus]
MDRVLFTSHTVASAQSGSEPVRASQSFVVNGDILSLLWTFVTFWLLIHKALLFQTLSRKFQEEAARTKRDRLMLTAAVAVGIEFIDLAYQTTEIHRQVNQFEFYYASYL